MMPRTMSSEAEKAQEDEMSDADATVDGPRSSDEPTGQSVSPSSPPKSPEQTLEQARADAQRYREQLLRTAADFDNFRKRTRRELEDAQRRGKEQSLKELLPVFDNLERAAGSAGAATDAKAVADGLRIVLKQFVDTLEKMGIRRIPTVGKAFDPTVHEAIQHIDSDEPAGVIVHEVQPGYAIGDYLLRAAMVVVSKGKGGG